MKRKDVKKETQFKLKTEPYLDAKKYLMKSSLAEFRACLTCGRIYSIKEVYCPWCLSPNYLLKKKVSPKKKVIK